MEKVFTHFVIFRSIIKISDC